MQSFLGVLLIIGIVFVAFYVVVYRAVRVVGHSRETHSLTTSNDQTQERAARLERESEEYRNVLVAQLIDRSERDRRRR